MLMEGREGATLTVALVHFHPQVAKWAYDKFVAEVAHHKPDSSINVTKACLLLALEEEATALKYGFTMG